MYSKTTRVNGTDYTIWPDITKHGTFAMSWETGEMKQLSHSGYITNDLTIRKAIAEKFHLPTFRKNGKECNA